MNDLKCCPFCGGEVIMSNEAIDSTREVYNFHCHNCDMVTFYDFPNDKEEAIKHWNRRTPMANIVEKLKYEKERHEKDRAYWSDKPWKDSCVYNEYDMADRKIDCYDDAINIVKQEINNGLE